MATTKTTTHKVGIYCRLSKDDGTDAESMSIGTQKAILSDYVNKQGWKLVKSYADDGYTGTNFNRPDFQLMIKDIEAGLIDCVITKDLSRLGRNYLDCGLYLEVFFPEHGVRYIAVNDNVDTLHRQSMDITPFRNILNDMYAADVSVKVSSALRSRFNQGKNTASAPPYGYRKDSADKNHLVVDEEMRPVVREIFDLALAGWGVRRISKHLAEKKILRPSAYAALRDGTYSRHDNSTPEMQCHWTENGVRMILRSPTYAGHLVGYKRPAISMKSKKRPSRLPEDWEVVKNTHEPIVTQEEFDTVQRLMTSRRHENPTGFTNIFAGIVKCADCGYAMRANPANRRKRPDPIDCVVYSCAHYNSYGTEACTTHNIEARDLFNVVLADINRLAADALKDDKAVRTLQKKLAVLGKGEGASLEREQRKATKRLGELDRLFAALYEDKVNGSIAERNYKMMAEKYEGEQDAITAKLFEVEGRLSEKETTERNAADFVSLIKGYSGLTELTAAVVNALIERITIGEHYLDYDGKQVQAVTIHYRFVGSLSECTMPVVKHPQATLSARVCENCGKEYEPLGVRARFCPECRPAMRKAAHRLYDRNRKDKRSKTHLDEQRVCQCCGAEFLPGSHNARFCPECKTEATAAAAKQWRHESYLKRRNIARGFNGTAAILTAP